MCPASKNSKLMSGVSSCPMRPPIDAEWRAKRLRFPAGKVFFQLAMGEERILGDAEFLAFFGHHVHGIVQHDVGEVFRRLAHEDGRRGWRRMSTGSVPTWSWCAWERMMASTESSGRRLKSGKAGTHRARMHTGIEHNAFARDFEKVAVCPDLDVAGQISKSDTLHDLGGRSGGVANVFTGSRWPRAEFAGRGPGVGAWLTIHGSRVFFGFLRAPKSGVTSAEEHDNGATDADGNDARQPDQPAAKNRERHHHVDHQEGMPEEERLSLSSSAGHG